MTNQTPASQERVLEDGTTRGYMVTESDDSLNRFKVTPFTRRSLDGRRTFYHNDYSLHGRKIEAHHRGRNFRDNGWAE